ncbi:MAG: CpaF family protein [Defluviitaleaceae bacterium]|nr:CpaF family protein [Defluviitaleaceae bacterium]
MSEGIEGDPRLTTYSDEQLREVILRLIDQHVEEARRKLFINDRQFVEEGVFAAIRGLGLLDEIVRDTDITEIMINGHDKIFIEKDGKQEQLKMQFESKEDLSRIITRFVQMAGRSVTEANPIVDTRLEDGSRVNVVIPPVAMDGAAVTIRRFPKVPMTVEKLIAYGSITPEVAHVLELLVKARFNIFVSGGTGSGKTTFLNALSNFIPRTERVITVEDSAELQIKAVDNLVRLETKVTTTKDAKEITIQDLIKSALRMRPDRIVVGEVRGAEALDMLQAMNTGHDGSLSTGHANSSRDMLSRLETMVIRAADLPLEAVRQQIASAVDVIVQLSRLRDHSRKTIEIVEVLGYNRDTREVELNPLYKFVESEKTTVEKVDGQLQRTENPLVNVEKMQGAGIYEEI